MFNDVFENHAICDIIEKNGTAGQATDNSITHAHYMLGT
jgi:hypothetical protein